MIGSAQKLLMARAGAIPVDRSWDISYASYSGVSFYFGSQDKTPQDISFNNTGTKMYILGSGNDRVYQYSLSTAFDVGTATYDTSFSVSPQDTSPGGISFNNDGTKMYAVGSSTDSVYQYSLSTAFDISTASYSGVNFSVAAQETNPVAVTFNNDGTKMYACGSSSYTAYEYDIG